MQHQQRNGAREGNRTLATSLEGWSSTTELLSHESFFKIYDEPPFAFSKWWAEKDSNLRSASATDLQSVLVDHLSICPFI